MPNSATAARSQLLWSSAWIQYCTSVCTELYYCIARSDPEIDTLDLVQTLPSAAGCKTVSTEMSTQTTCVNSDTAVKRVGGGTFPQFDISLRQFNFETESEGTCALYSVHTDVLQCTVQCATVQLSTVHSVHFIVKCAIHSANIKGNSKQLTTWPASFIKL